MVLPSSVTILSLPDFGVLKLSIGTSTRSLAFLEESDTVPKRRLSRKTRTRP